MERYQAIKGHVFVLPRRAEKARGCGTALECLIPVRTKPSFYLSTSILSSISGFTRAYLTGITSWLQVFPVVVFMSLVVVQLLPCTINVINTHENSTNFLCVLGIYLLWESKASEITVPLFERQFCFNVRTVATERRILIEFSPKHRFL